MNETRPEFTNSVRTEKENISPLETLTYGFYLRKSFMFILRIIQNPQVQLWEKCAVIQY
jgi:hypothetical protein